MAARHGGGLTLFSEQVISRLGSTPALGTIMDEKQLSLFDDSQIEPPKINKVAKGSKAAYYDYESYIAKFADTIKTTDDTYTPKDVYEAVIKYVSTITDLSDKVILRPFYPGGDYVNEEYPENGIVIDNPPFSIFTKICAFYTVHNIPFFLFGPGLTIGSCFKYCTAVIVAESIRFENGAVVKCNFASNLYGNTLMITAPYLNKLLKKCPSQNQKVNLQQYVYPENVLSVSDMQTISKYRHPFSVTRDNALIIKSLDNNPRGEVGEAIRRPSAHIYG